MRAKGEEALREADLELTSHLAGVVELGNSALMTCEWKLNAVEGAIRIAKESPDAASGVLIESGDLASIIDRLSESDFGSGGRVFEGSVLAVFEREADGPAARPGTLGAGQTS